MSFEQDLRAYLERMEGETPDLRALPIRHVDEHELRRHFLTRMRELENEGAPDTVKRLFDEWPDQLARFARTCSVNARTGHPGAARTRSGASAAS